MISSYNITTQNVAVDGLLTFTTDRILTGCRVSRNGPAFQLNEAGYYCGAFSASGCATSVADVTIELQKNGIAVPGAIATITPAAVGNTMNFAFATIIKVPPSCCAVDNTANLTLVNTGVAAIFTNVNINITKLC